MLQKGVMQGVQRCPKCFKATLEYDPETSRIMCSSCKYEVKLRK